MLRMRITSSLEKCFYDQSTTDKPILSEISLLKNERYSFQICYDDPDPIRHSRSLKLTVESPLVDHMKIYTVGNVPSTMPIFNNSCDGYYERTTPGLFPDYLQPFDWKNDWFCADNTLRAMWIELEPNGEFEGGVYPIRFTVTRRDHPEFQPVVLEAEAEIINAELPEQELIYTQWLYTDCLMNYYETEAFDEKHWSIIERFMVNARRYGMNMILTPVLTPELDTYVGGERPTTQLVDVTRNGTEYSFDFSKLGRWVDLCDKVGIQYLEISHLYSQWGAAACPKVIAKADGEEKQIFGWDTPSDGDEYKAFLSALIPAMLEYLRTEKNGADKRCWFHISDEPGGKHLETYGKLSRFLQPLLEGYPVMDALSHYEYYEQGLVKNPIPCHTDIEPFLENNVPNLWTYYCASCCDLVSNRLMSMPSARNRIIGTQFYKFNICGFLHWGYNNYNGQKAYVQNLNPFACTDGDGWVPSGDAFSVYPGPKGQPWPSLRQVVFYDALQDQRALSLCERLCGREKTMEILEGGIAPLTFRDYPRDPQWLLNLRTRINNAIKNAVG